MAIIGIDLGTTNSLAAVWHGGKCALIPNAAGEYLTPSVVSLEEDGTVLVGNAARERLISHPDRTVACFKRTMGTPKTYTLGTRTFTSEELSSLVLRRLREDAEIYLGEPVTEAVVSVPAYFSEAQRSATKQAGALAGLVVDRLINEPSAAAVASHIGEGAEDKVCLVFDFGGGTLDVSLVERFEHVVSVTAVSGDNHLGGHDFDLAIAQGFCDDCGLDYNALPLQQQELLIRQAETCKFGLTASDTVLMVVSSAEISASLPLSNEWLIRKSSALFRRMSDPVRRVLLDAGLSASDLDELVMVGGSSHMPAVRKYITRTLGREPSSGAQPDTGIALGVGICAGMKARVPELRELVLTDVCPFSLGVSIHNASEPGRDLMSPILERNCALPSSKERTYCTSYDQQRKIVVGVFQGENRYCEDNTNLGQLSLHVPPAPAGEQLVRIRFTYDINGLLEVEAVGNDAQKVRLLLQNPSMNPKEAERRLKELQTLKLHPREQEENRILLARGQRLYAITVGEPRTQIGDMLDWFQLQLTEQEPLRVAKAAKRMAKFLDQMEAFWGEPEDPFNTPDWGDDV